MARGGNKVQGVEQSAILGFRPSHRAMSVGTRDYSTGKFFQFFLRLPYAACARL